MKKSILILVISVIAILLLLSACTKTGGQTTVNKTVPVPVSTAVLTELSIDIKDFNFVPNTTTLKVGGTVMWTNSDNTRHQLFSRDLFDSKALDPGKTFKFTFPNPGTYDYNCLIHPAMLGKIVVVE